MKTKLRKILFLAFLGLFIAVGLYVGLTAQGWVIDFENFSVVKTGAIFIKFSPSDAVFTLNGKKPKDVSSGLIQSGHLLKNLAPGDYRIKISKEGYEPWEKNLRVESGLIVSASQVKLWPTEIKTRPGLEGVDDFAVTKKGLVYKANGRLVFDEGLLIRGEKIAWAEAGSNFIVTKSGDDFFLIDLENPLPATNLTALFNSLKQRQLNLPGFVPIREIAAHPFSPSKFMILSPTSLYALDIKKIQLEIMLTVPGIKAATLGQNEAFVLDEGDKLHIVNLLLKNVSLETLKTSSTLVRVSPSGSKIFLVSDEKELFFFKRSPFEGLPLHENIKDFYLSPEEKRIGLLGAGGELEIFYLANYQGDLKHAAGTADKITIETNEEIKKISWLPKTLNYILVLSGENLVVGELDPRLPMNSQVMLRGVLDYKLAGEQLYVLKKDKELLALNLAELN